MQETTIHLSDKDVFGALYALGMAFGAWRVLKHETEWKYAPGMFGEMTDLYQHLKPLMV